MNPVLLKLGPFQVHWYGLLIVTGAVIAAWLATKEAKRRGEDPEHVWNMLTWCLILGIVGARLYHVFSTPTGNFAGWSYYRENPIEIIAFWHGGFRGLGIYGAVAGGVVAVVLYCLFGNRALARKKAAATQILTANQEALGGELVQGTLAADLGTLAGIAEQQKRLALIKDRVASLPAEAAKALGQVIDALGQRVLVLPRWLDILTPGLLLAQAIGRMGNFINQELYGPATDKPWAFHINPAFPCQEPAGSPLACGLPERLTAEARQWYATNGFHPTFFYEALWNVAGFLLLWFGGRKLAGWLRDGDIILAYLIWYGVGRFWVEMFRPDAWVMGALATAQWIGLGMVVVGIAGILFNHLRPGKNTAA